MKPIDWRGMFWPAMNPLEVVLRATLVYLFAQLAFRVVGRKELRRYSTFNVAVLFLISVAMRETIITDDHSVTSGLVGFATVFGWNWLLSYLSFKNRRLADLIEGPVRTLVEDGRVIPEQLRRARISVDRLLAEARLHGRTSLDDVERACLEHSGEISFIFRGAKEPP